jgi:hypothetical protein
MFVIENGTTRLSMFVIENGTIVPDVVCDD